MHLIYSICQHSQGPTALPVCVCGMHYMFFIVFDLNLFSEFSDLLSLKLNCNNSILIVYAEPQWKPQKKSKVCEMTSFLRFSLYLTFSPSLEILSCILQFNTCGAILQHADVQGYTNKYMVHGSVHAMQNRFTVCNLSPFHWTCINRF